MSTIQIIQENKKARFEYEVIKTYEAGLQLVGSEVKAIRDKSVQLKDAYIAFRGDEAFLQSAHISEFKMSSYNNHAPERLRKLLLHRSELDQIYGSLRERGLSCIPLKIYFKGKHVKIEIALVKGKKLHDKREALKTRDVQNQLRQTMRHRQK